MSAGWERFEMATFKVGQQVTLTGMGNLNGVVLNKARGKSLYTVEFERRDGSKFVDIVHETRLTKLAQHK